MAALGNWLQLSWRFVKFLKPEIRLWFLWLLGFFLTVFVSFIIAVRVQIGKIEFISIEGSHIIFRSLSAPTRVLAALQPENLSLSWVQAHLDGETILLWENPVNGIEQLSQFFSLFLAPEFALLYFLDSLGLSLLVLLEILCSGVKLEGQENVCFWVYGIEESSVLHYIHWM